jgi:hypothetical protein
VNPLTSTLPGLDPAALHPEWCSPGFCEPDGPTTAHLSAPIVWRMEGSDVDVIMRRRQEGLAGEALIEVLLTNDQCPEESTLLYLTKRDRDQWLSGVQELCCGS